MVPVAHPCKLDEAGRQVPAPSAHEPLVGVASREHVVLSARGRQDAEHNASRRHREQSEHHVRPSDDVGALHTQPSSMHTKTRAGDGYVLKLLGDEDAALDVLQEVWLKVFRTIGALRSPEALRTWLYRVARGTALNRVRDDSARVGAEEALDPTNEFLPTGPGLRPDDVLDVQAALDHLDRRHREVLVLLFREGLTIDEIARVVGAPPGTVRSRIHHAKMVLGALLEGHGHE